MKILMAIEATDHKNIADRSLRWAARSGYELRIFVPRNKRRKFLEALEDCNYHYYNALSYDQLITRSDPISYAKEHGFDLLLMVPQHLTSWQKGMEFKDKEINRVFQTVGAARGQFSRDPDMTIKRFTNGSVMYRVNSL